MGSITWGAVREIIKENEDLKSKVEHLETRLFEVENFIRDLLNQNQTPKQNQKPKEN